MYFLIYFYLKDNRKKYNQLKLRKPISNIKIELKAKSFA